MALIPVVQNLHEEFVLYVTMIDSERTMDEVCTDVAKVSIGFDKNGRPDKPLRVRKVGEDSPFPRDMKVGEAGIQPMMGLEFYYEDDASHHE
jgi:toluene monooxygenase system protein B